MADAKVELAQHDKSPEAEDPQRRNLAMALFGALGGAALLEACTAEGAGPDADLVGQVTQAATGTTIRWADTVLGAAPPGTRTGDLATKNSSALGGTILVIAKGCVTPGDGGGGAFYWEAGVSTGDNGGTIIVPQPSQGGRWRRIYSGPLNVLWFGAKGDGIVDDRAAINLAKVACPTTGGSVYFPGGKTYKISDSIVFTSYSNLSVHSDRSATIQPALDKQGLVFNTCTDVDVHGLTIQQAQQGLVFNTCTNVDVYGLTMPQAQQGLVFTSCTNVEVHGLAIQQAQDKRGLVFDTCTHVEVHALRLRGTIQTHGGDPGGGNTGQTGIVLETCTGVNVHHCVFKELGGYGVWPHADCKDVVVQSNYFDQTMAGCQAGAGGGFTLSDIRILDNTFVAYNPALSGGAGTLGSDDQIACFGGLSGSIIISRNYIDKRGIDTASQLKVQATCITIESDNLSGDIRDVIISENVCVNNYSTHASAGRASIYIFGPPPPLSSPGTPYNILVSNNVIRLGNSGIFFNYLGQPCNLANISILDNMITDIRTTGPVSPMGIEYVASGGGNLASRMVVRGNMIDGVDGEGIYLGPVCESVIVEGNTVKSPGRLGTSPGPGQAGIFLSNALKDYLIANNQVIDGGSVGIAVTDGKSLRVIGNLAAHCVSAGFVLNNTEDSTVQGNISRNNSERGFSLTGNKNLALIGNSAYENTSDGLVTVGANVGLRVIGNSFHNNGVRGISYQDTSGTAVFEGNFLTGNSVAQFSDFSTTSTWYAALNPDAIKAPIELDEIPDPAAPGANKGRVYCRDNGAGKSQLVVRFPSGAVQVIATEP